MASKLFPESRKPIHIVDLDPGTGAFTADEIAAVNRRHDLKYGWNPQSPTIYTNMARLPETLIGSIEDYWNRINTKSATAATAD